MKNFFRHAKLLSDQGSGKGLYDPLHLMSCDYFIIKKGKQAVFPLNISVKNLYFKSINLLVLQ